MGKHISKHAAIGSAKGKLPVPAIRLSPPAIHQLKTQLQRLEASRKPEVRRFVKQMLDRYPFLNEVGQ
jgi:hypothetical protein